MIIEKTERGWVVEPTHPDEEVPLAFLFEALQHRYWPSETLRAEQRVDGTYEPMRVIEDRRPETYRAHKE